jgi:DNA-binding NtrC family response regulator
MAKSIRLSDDDRGFFDLVSRAAFCNPFGEERVNLDLKIAECTAGTPHDKRIERIVGRVRERVLRLAEKGKADLRLYSAKDRQNLQAAFMFDIFHRVSLRFDTLIQDQIKLGQTPSPVPFARETLGMFAERGFSIPESVRFFAMLYQIRRAFYFINRSLIGSSASMRQLRLHLWNNVFTHDIRWYEQYLWNRMEDFSTLLLGETGTGKGTAAAAIGRSGFIPFDEKKGCFAESFTRNFLAINLSQFAESLIESELFGHKKGAFTGAVEHHEGVFTRCTPHGSIFLDEIGDISVPIQVKLLQVLQDRTFVPVGSHQQLRFSGRVIAATNQPLDELRRKGQFREDLFYRLCSDVIVVPSLRQRLREDPEELVGMIAHVVKRIVGEDSTELVEMVREVIENDLGPGYSWLGNVRELEQAVRRILLTRRISPDSGKDLYRDCTPCLLSPTEVETMSAQELLEKYCLLLYERFGTYEEVSRRIRLDRRTVKKYILNGRKVR